MFHGKILSWSSYFSLPIYKVLSRLASEQERGILFNQNTPSKDEIVEFQRNERPLLNYDTLWFSIRSFENIFSNTIFPRKSRAKCFDSHSVQSKHNYPIYLSSKNTSKAYVLRRLIELQGELIFFEKQKLSDQIKKSLDLTIILLSKNVFVK